MHYERMFVGPIKFKSSITADYETIIFCFYCSDGYMFRYIYDLYNNYQQFYSYNVKCLQKYYGLKIGYYEEKDEFYC